MFDELLKKELLKKGILERKSKDNMDIDTNDYKIKKLDEPMRVVVLFETLKKIYPESKDNIRRNVGSLICPQASFGVSSSFLIWKMGPSLYDCKSYVI